MPGVVGAAAAIGLAQRKSNEFIESSKIARLERLGGLSLLEALAARQLVGCDEDDEDASTAEKNPGGGGGGEGGGGGSGGGGGGGGARGGVAARARGGGRGVVSMFGKAVKRSGSGRGGGGGRLVARARGRGPVVLAATSKSDARDTADAVSDQKGNGDADGDGADIADTRGNKEADGAGAEQDGDVPPGSGPQAWLKAYGEKTMVGRCRFTVSKPAMKAPLVPALETIIS